MNSETPTAGSKGLKALGFGATLLLLVVGVINKGILKGVVYYVVSVLIAYLGYLIILGLIGGAFTDLSKLFKNKNMRKYAGEYASPIAAVALSFLTAYLFHHLHYAHQLFIAFIIYMIIHVYLLFIDRKMTGMTYSWSSLVLTEIVYVGAIFLVK
jgi:hypothetical protein